jgi:hypothetical protein
MSITIPPVRFLLCNYIEKCNTGKCTGFHLIFIHSFRSKHFCPRWIFSELHSRGEHKHMKVSMQTVHYLGPILTKAVLCGHTLIIPSLAVTWERILATFRSERIKKLITNTADIIWTRKVKRLRMVELYLPSPICPYGKAVFFTVTAVITSKWSEV